MMNAHEIEYVHVGIEAAHCEFHRAPYGDLGPHNKVMGICYRILSGPDREETRWVSIDEDGVWDFFYMIDYDCFPPGNRPEDFSTVWEVLDFLVWHHVGALLSLKDNKLLPMSSMAAYFNAAIAREHLFHAFCYKWQRAESVWLSEVTPSNITCVVPDEAANYAFTPQGVFSSEVRLTLKDTKGCLYEVLLTDQDLPKFLALNIPPARTLKRSNGTRELQLDLGFLRGLIVHVPQSQLAGCGL